MTRTNIRQDEDLDVEWMNVNGSSLARKADIRQYPTGARSSRSPQDAYSRAAHTQSGRPGNVQEAASGARRNPYLASYSQDGRSGRSDTGRRTSQREKKDVDLIWGEEVERPISRRTDSRNRAASDMRGAAQGRQEPKQRAGQNGAAPQRRPGQNGTIRQEYYTQRSTAPQPRQRSIMEDRAGLLAREQRRNQAQALRRRQMMQKKIILGAVELLSVIVIVVLVYQGFFKKSEQTDHLPAANPQENMGQTPAPAPSGDTVQGIDAAVFAKHPEWEENFLTPNEYSRPGDPLTEVKNIFVHYTANPNTSAKQNRSYFEQQKDTHESSVSSHFIIGYNGEILQIVPMDEIAYAVMTRNLDSISIECCYKAENGQFTQETYDSLIALLSWLTEAYHLDSEDILRHYDCGGKKCPIYYTEHEDAWDRLKKDVEDYTL